MIRDSQTSPYAPSGTWPAMTRTMGIDPAASDLDSWTELPADDEPWSETAIDLEIPKQARPMLLWLLLKSGARMNGRAVGEVVFAVLLMCAFVALVAAGMTLIGPL